MSRELFPRRPRRRVIFALASSPPLLRGDRKSTRLNSSHLVISYAVFCLKKKNKYPNSKQLAKDNICFAMKNNKTVQRAAFIYQNCTQDVQSHNKVNGVRAS